MEILTRHLRNVQAFFSNVRIIHIILYYNLNFSYSLDTFVVSSYLIIYVDFFRKIMTQLNIFCLYQEFIKIMYDLGKL